MTKLFLVRHGQSTWNALGLVQGASDEPELTPRGRAQAAAAAERLRGAGAARLLSSDLRRASATAAIIGSALGLDSTTTPLLREQDTGVLTGLSTGAALADGPAAPVDWRDPDHRCGGGESVRMVAARWAELLATDLIAASPGPVICVGHGTAMQIGISLLLGEDLGDMPWRTIANGEVYPLDLDFDPALDPAPALHPAGAGHSTRGVPAGPSEPPGAEFSVG